MTNDVHDRTLGRASATAIESLLLTLDDAAEWQHRAASRVRSFVTSAPQVRSVVADEAAVHDELRPRHERRAL